MDEDRILGIERPHPTLLELHVIRALTASGSAAAKQPAAACAPSAALC